MTSPTNPTDGPELKPCPFPHEVRRGVFLEVDTEDFGFVRGACSDCGAAGPFVDIAGRRVPTEEQEQEAARLWNTRVQALSSKNELPSEVDWRHLVERNEKRFWLVVHEPGLIPRIKGPYLDTGTKEMLRDFMRLYPTAYIDVLKINSSLSPEISHGPEVLQILDGRSMGTGRKHNERTRIAHGPHHEALSNTQVTRGDTPNV
jgi:hypothetical protein